MTTIQASAKLQKISNMKAAFAFRLGAICALRAISEHRMERKAAKPVTPASLSKKLASLKPANTGKAIFLIG